MCLVVTNHQSTVVKQCWPHPGVASHPQGPACQVTVPHMPHQRQNLSSPRIKGSASLISNHRTTPPHKLTPQRHHKAPRFLHTHIHSPWLSHTTHLHIYVAKNCRSDPNCAVHALGCPGVNKCTAPATSAETAARQERHPHNQGPRASHPRCLLSRTAYTAGTPAHTKLCQHSAAAG